MGNRSRAADTKFSIVGVHLCLHTCIYTMFFSICSNKANRAGPVSVSLSVFWGEKRFYLPLCQLSNHMQKCLVSLCKTLLWWCSSSNFTGRMESHDAKFLADLENILGWVAPWAVLVCEDCELALIQWAEQHFCPNLQQLKPLDFRKTVDRD